MIPDRETCLQILKGKTNEGIFNHIMKVTDVALQIGRAYKEAGYEIDLKLLEAGALLHDVCKYEETQNKGKRHHADMACEFVAEKFPELKGIVEKHHNERILKEDYHTWTLEEKIVHYADKRVTTKIVSLKERIEDWKIRYPYAIQEIVKSEPLQYKFEKELFSKIDLKPEDIK